jgi:hypothetical protein
LVRILVAQPVIKYLILTMFLSLRQAYFHRKFRGFIGLALTTTFGRDGFTRDFGRVRHENLLPLPCRVAEKI